MKKFFMTMVMVLGLGMTTVCNADPVGGPKYNHTSVNAFSTDTYHVTLRAGERTMITLSGDGDTDLDLYIYDANGNLIDVDNDYTDDCVCTVVPRWTGRFTIKVVNRGRVYNRYNLDIY